MAAYNREDLTFAEWLAASFCEGDYPQVTLRNAWRQSEDPTEWRASKEKSDLKAK